MSELWAIVELMGHVRLAGRLTEEEHFGAKLGRLDIPKDDGFVTQFFGGQSVYRITPVAEEVARAVAARSTPEPVHSWEMPKALPAPPVPGSSFLPDDPDDDDDSTLQPDDDTPDEPSTPANPICPCGSGKLYIGCCGGPF